MRLALMRTRIAVVTLATALTAATQPSRRPISLVVVGRTVVTENTRHRLVSPGAVAIDEATIVDVDSPEAIARKYRAAETIEARDQIVLPGLINTHTHAPMVMF